MGWLVKLDLGAPMYIWVRSSHTISTLKLKQTGCHFVDIILKCTFSNESTGISIKLSLIIRIQLRPDPSHKLIIMVYFLMHICSTLPQWVNILTYEPFQWFPFLFGLPEMHPMPYIRNINPLSSNVKANMKQHKNVHLTSGYRSKH